MTKPKKIRLPILLKIWLAIMAIVVAVLVLVWGVQVVFLEQYYVGLKRNELASLSNDVAAAINENGVLLSQNKMMELAGNNRLCIEVVMDNDRVLTVEGLAYDCYLHERNQTAEQALVREARESQTASIRMVRDSTTQTEYLISVSYVNTGSEGGGYVLIITQTLAPVYEAAAVTRTQLLWISGILIILATAVAFFVARLFTKPIVKLSKAAQEIARGNLDITVPVTSTDELGELSQNFNYMASELNKINKLERELVANLSHDIRTPLTMIRGYAEMIKDITGDNKAQREEQLDIIVDETNRLSRLANDALDLSRMQAGQIVMKYTVFDAAQKLRDIVSRYRLLEQTEGFHFVCNAPEHCIVYADETRIEQVVYNLLNNAVNHTEDKKCITLSLHTEKGTAWIAVQDMGSGIAPEDLPLIWDRYYKPYHKDRPGMGTGLGLSIVKAVLEGHQAPFGVNSELGKGSIFWFGLRIAQEEKQKSGEKEAAEGKKQNGRKHTAKN